MNEPRYRTEEVATYEAKDLREVVLILGKEKLTGQLTIHFTQGSVGGIEFRRKIDKPSNHLTS